MFTRIEIGLFILSFLCLMGGLAGLLTWLLPLFRSDRNLLRRRRWALLVLDVGFLCFAGIIVSVVYRHHRFEGSAFLLIGMALMLLAALILTHSIRPDHVIQKHHPLSPR